MLQYNQQSRPKRVLPRQNSKATRRAVLQEGRSTVLRQLRKPKVKMNKMSEGFSTLLFVSLVPYTLGKALIKENKFKVGIPTYLNKRFLKGTIWDTNGLSKSF